MFVKYKVVSDNLVNCTIYNNQSESSCMCNQFEMVAHNLALHFELVALNLSLQFELVALNLALQFAYL